jgi:signal peptidase II
MKPIRVSKNNGIYRKTAYLAASFGFFLLDQTTKIWARESLRFSDSVAVIPNFLNFIYAENTGVAFSQLSGGGETGRWLLSALAGIAALAVLYYLWRAPKTETRISSALALLLAGILGNFASRVRFGFVVDWIDVQFGAWHYPTFNLADVWICTGAGLLILDMFSSPNTEADAGEKTD